MVTECLMHMQVEAIAISSTDEAFLADILLSMSSQKFSMNLSTKAFWHNSVPELWQQVNFCDVQQIHQHEG